jgi:Putative peptidoglycan binding domain
MSTQFDTPNTRTDETGAYGQPVYGQPAAGRRPSGYRIAAVVIGTVIAAALIVLAAVGLTRTSTSTPAPGASTSAPAQTVNPAQPATPAQTVNPAQPTTPASPAVVPSASVKKLQQELGQLNYYQGPVDGVMGPQTTAAIADLQRQAGLPQTGTMNAATQKALGNYLAHGNSQMGGNS